LWFQQKSKSGGKISGFSKTFADHQEITPKDIKSSKWNALLLQLPDTLIRNLDNLLKEQIKN
jgi:hypothetical protein